MGKVNEMSLEVEVKFFVPDLAAFRQRLVAAGGVLEKPRVFERNVRYDNAWQGLTRKLQLLRLRQDGQVRLTFKGEPITRPDTQAKIREELEVYVNDFEQMAAILQRIGFEPMQVYEKYRETFHFEEVEVVLDELPFGNFVELEGDEAAIRAASGRIGLDWETRILDNYLALMGKLKAHHQLPFADLTFANFSGRNISIADVWK